MATILAIDDSASMRMLVESTLKQHGHTVVVAEDGIKGLAAASTHSVDVVLTDINMPGLNGIELVMRLREKQEYRFTPILMLTTEGSADMKNKGRAAGATGWITKPFDPDKLMQVLSKVL